MFLPSGKVETITTTETAPMSSSQDMFDNVSEKEKPGKPP